MLGVRGKQTPGEETRLLSQVVGAQEVMNPTLWVVGTQEFACPLPGCSREAAAPPKSLLPSDAPSRLSGSSVLGVTHIHLTGAPYVIFIFNLKIYIWGIPWQSSG